MQRAGAARPNRVATRAAPANLPPQMKRLLVLSILLATTLTAEADSTAGSAQQALRDKLPAYSPEQHARAVAEAEAIAKTQAEAKAAAAADPELVVLAPMTVMEKAQQQMTEESLYRKGAYDKELVRRELSEFDRYFLNRVTIPLLSSSNEARAREAYLARKNSEFQDKMARLNRMVAALDEREAREFREVLRDTSLDNGNTAKETARARSARGGTGGRNSQ